MGQAGGGDGQTISDVGTMHNGGRIVSLFHSLAHMGVEYALSNQNVLKDFGALE